METVLKLPPTLTVEQLLKVEGWPLGRSATYDAVRRGEIPSVRIGGRILIPSRAIERLFAGEAA